MPALTMAGKAGIIVGALIVAVLMATFTLCHGPCTAKAAAAAGVSHASAAHTVSTVCGHPSTSTVCGHPSS